MRPPLGPAFSTQLLLWFDAHQRALPWRGAPSPYAVWVSEVMLQQTRVESARHYYERFMQRFPDVAALAQADEQDVLQHWAGLGYYARARNLHRAAQIVSREHSGKIPDDPTRFASLPGCGPYITAAVQSIAFGAPLAAVDGNVKRVLARLDADPFPVNHTRAHRHYLPRAQELLSPHRPGDHNQAMMELGALICTPRNPDCPRCPVAAFCTARAQDTAHRLPVREKKQRAPLRHFVSVILVHRRHYLLFQRPAKGLLGGLWEFPSAERTAQETAQEACARYVHARTGHPGAAPQHATQLQHAYTHFRLHIDVYYCPVPSRALQAPTQLPHHWLPLDDVADFPLSSVNQKILRWAQQHNARP